MIEQVVKTIDEKLSAFDTISLEEMSGIRLMNRIDTKFLVNVNQLPILLDMAQKDYFVQKIGDLRKAFYRTLYYDTPTATMYTVHHDGKIGGYNLDRSSVDRWSSPQRDDCIRRCKSGKEP